MTVGTHDDEVGRDVSRMRKDRVRHVNIGANNALYVNLQTMASKVFPDISTRHFITLYRLARHYDYVDRVGASEERHGIPDGTCRSTAAIPAHHDAIELEAGLLNVGDDEHRPPGLE